MKKRAMAVVLMGLITTIAAWLLRHTIAGDQRRRRRPNWPWSGPAVIPTLRIAWCLCICTTRPGTSGLQRTASSSGGQVRPGG